MVDEDRLLPIANVGRIMKQVLPPTAKISKEAKQTMQECATEFISFVTGDASDKCNKENRKTVTGDDLCWALSTLGFDDYSDAILRYIHKLREHEREKAKDHRQPQNKAGINEGGGGGRDAAAQAALETSNFAPLDIRIIEKDSNSRGLVEANIGSSSRQ